MATTQLITVVGARPQFVKAAALSRAIEAFNAAGPDHRIEQQIVHTGQHYSGNMSAMFFDELRLPVPRVNLGVGSLSHAAQTAAMMEGLEALFRRERPRWVVVFGDTNSTLAAALAAAKIPVPIAHVEAGVRSGLRRQPEEINRVLTDRLASLLLTPSPAAGENLRREGVSAGVHHVGDLMYDLLKLCLPQARALRDTLTGLSLAPRQYYLATIHRAENVDDAATLAGIFQALGGLKWPVVVPLHPRTAARLGDSARPPNVRCIEPVGYLDMLALQQGARIVLTDGGGIQKEAFWLDRPGVILRGATEWPELVDAGCNLLAGTAPQAIAEAVETWERRGLCLPADRPRDIYGDGHSADRIVRLLAGLPAQETP